MMTCLRGFVACTLVLAGIAFSVPEVMGADDFMILRYADGSTQRIRLDRPSESIRQIEFLEGRRESGHDDWRGGIRIIAATYGGNCGAPLGNVTAHPAEACDGRATCEYVIDFRVLGDPAPGCLKDYRAEWECGRERDRRDTSVGPGGTKVVLRCPAR